MGRIIIGVSSWADPGLVKSGFYPGDVKTPAARLSYYASRFPVAEIDSSFRFFPTQRNLGLWLNATPAGFVFDMKAFSLFTQHPTPLNAVPRSIRERYAGVLPPGRMLYLHHFPREAVDELWALFGRVIKQVDGKLGAVLFQFPPWFHPEPANYDHISECRKRLARHPVAIEFRAPSWLDDVNRNKTLGFLRGLKATLVCVDEPQGLKTSMPHLAEVTAPLAIVRFHGRNRENWERPGVTPQARHEYVYTEEELRECLPQLRRMADQSDEMHIIFMNKQADAPVQNALMMKRLLEA